MRRLVIFLLLVGTTATDAPAACTYFRVTAKAIKCTASDDKKAVQEKENPYEIQNDIPELTDPADRAKTVQGKVVHLLCDCEYSLKGSNFLCDMERVNQISETLSTEDAATTCRRKHNICRELCPKTIP